MSLTRVPIPTTTYSSRGGARVTTVVLHTAEGARTYQDLGQWFINSANTGNPTSSHVGIDDTVNTVGEYVPRSGKAWTAANANPYSVQAELCAFAAWDSTEWSKHPTMLANAAQWVAEEAAYFGIPIVALTPAQAQDPNVSGVCQHIDLGAMGGGHVDCGPAFPFAQVLAMATGAAPSPTPPPQEDDMPGPVALNNGNNQESFYVAGNGRLMHCYQTPGKPWVTESLSSGWDPKAQLMAMFGPGNVMQVWGMTSAGKTQQCYWSGKQWVTQPIG